MKPLSPLVPLAALVVSLAAGMPAYIVLNGMGALPLGVRDHPWPMIVLAAAATLLAIVAAVNAVRQHRFRGLAIVSAVVASLGLLGFVAFVEVASAQVPAPPTALAVGVRPPEFTLPDEAGKATSLTDLAGQPTLLVFYRGSWCPFCRSELIGLARSAPDFERAKVRVVAISVDPPAESARMKEELHLPFTLLSDVDGAVITRFGLLHKNGHGDLDVSRPANLLLDANGVIRWSAFTDNFRVRPHPDDILAEVARLH